MGNEPQSWVKSRIVRWMFVYWAVIILLTYAAEWIGRHGPALDKVLVVVGLGLVLLVIARIVAWYRRDRMW
jgi:hypothetical protein